MIVGASAFSPEVLRLRGGLETMHGGTATFVQSVPVRDSFDRDTVWECVVHVFDLAGNPRASRGYAWLAPWGNDGEARFFAYLHLAPIDSPVRAVRAAALANAELSNDA